MAIKVFVCGDSWCSGDTNLPGTHFSELLGSGYEVTNIARGGMSNTGICFQLKTALQLDAEIVIFGTTDSSRMDIPLKSFRKHLGLKNFIYPYKFDPSYGHPLVGDLTSNILTGTMHDLMSDRWDSLIQLPDEKKKALKEYLTHLFDYELESQKDEWLIECWTNKLSNKNIKLIHLNKEYSSLYRSKIVDCQYHTSPEVQIQVAEFLKKKLKELMQ